ncbi:MAG: hydrogenase 3 maturation endopeptidase HyCI [Candidatus Njordarchaeota archaeon]
MSREIEQLERHILDFIKNAKKIAVLTIGNPLRGDDAAGVIIGEKLKNKINADIFIGETAPESYVIKIADSGYTHVIIIDTAIIDRPPGSIFIVEKDKLAEGIMTTHSIPISFMIDFLEGNNIKTLIIGIRPKHSDFTQEISEEVKNAIDRLTEILIRTIK